MKLDIISPEKTLFSGEVDSVQLPGKEGSFGILNNHAPIIATLKKGTLKVNNKGKESTFDINGGVVEVNNNKVIVLAE